MELIWIFQTVSEGEFSEVGHTQRAKDHSFGGCSRPHLSAPCLHEMGYGLHARGCRSERRESFMSEENKTWARRAGEITSPDDLDLIEEVHAPDLVWHEPDQEVRGIEEGKRYVSDAPASPPLDTLAQTLADGTISRKQALKLMGTGAAVACLALAVVAKNRLRRALPVQASPPAAPLAIPRLARRVRHPSKDPPRRRWRRRPSARWRSTT